MIRSQSVGLSLAKETAGANLTVGYSDYSTTDVFDNSVISVPAGWRGGEVKQ